MFIGNKNLRIKRNIKYINFRINIILYNKICNGNGIFNIIFMGK